MNELQRAELFKIRKALDGLVVKIAEVPAEVNENMVAIRKWHQGAYVVGDVRMYEGAPYKCVQAHDSTSNETWNPAATPALWMQYHGTSKATARPWLQPFGSEDRYKAGEWMIWTDGFAYPCISDTTYPPTTSPQAWGAGESIE